MLFNLFHDSMFHYFSMFIWDIIPTNSTISKFYFPLSKDDLLNADDLCADSEITLSSEGDVLQSLQSVLADISSSPLYILIHFDLLASVLFHYAKIPVPQIIDGLDSFNESGKEFIHLIQSLSLDRQAEFGDRHCSISCCCLMRLIYLISEWISELFKNLKSNSYFRTEKSKVNSKYKDINLNSICHKSIELISSLLSSDIRLLFTHTFQDSFIDTIRFILNPVYLFLSQNSLLNKYSTVMLGCISQCLNKFPSLLIEISVKLSEILQLAYLGIPSQTLPPALLNFFDQLITLLPNLGFQMMREVVSRIDLEKDSPEIRIFGMMLTVVTNCKTDPELSNVKLMFPLLNAECYTVRNGALTVIAQMIRCSENIKPSKTSEDIPNESETDLGDISTETSDISLLSCLVKSLYDCNAFVRARCVTLIASLWERDLIPIDLQNEILNIIAGRLCDKCALVRKNALGLMVISLKKNPYRTVTLDLTAFLKSLEREVGILDDFQGKNVHKSCAMDLNEIESEIHSGITDIIDNSEYLCSVNQSDHGEEALFDRLESEIAIGYIPDCITAMDLLKKHHPHHKLFRILDRESEAVLLSLTRNDLLVLSTLLRKLEMKKEDGEHVDTEFIESQKKKIQFLHSGISFIENFSLSLKDALHLIRSKAHSDVTAVISFLSEYNKNELPGHSTCINPILYLIWSSHQTHRNCALDTFIDIFFTKIEQNSTHQEVHFALAKNLCKFVSSKLSYGDFFTFEEIIISLVKEDKFPELVIKTIFQIFVRDSRKETIDPELQLKALILISIIGKGDSSILHRHMETIFEICYRKNMLNLDLGRYGSIALNSLNSNSNNDQINRIKRLPVANQVFKSMHVLVSSTLTDPSKNWAPFMMETVHLIFELSQDPFKIFSEIILHCSSIVKCLSSESKKLIGMARFICLLGKVAQLHVILLDKYVCRSDKINSTVTGQNFDTTSNENVPNIFTENEILSGVGLLSRFKGLIIHILQTYFHDSSKNSDNEQANIHPIILQLQSSSLFALSQYMLLSIDFCEENINLLFTLLSKHPCSSVRESCICAVSDLILRFPNILQPWIPLIFNSLRDASSSVRKHTILVLSHLILIDMIKIQGHVAEIAYLLLDGDETISEIAKIFFSKISQKSNALYNSLADIISHILDIDNLSLDTDKLKFILKYLFSFIQKEKQVDNLVEKLITRLKTAQDNTRKDLIGYSISLLPHSDRTLKILITEFPLIKLLVQDEQTKSHFVSISTSLHRKSISTQDVNKLLVVYDNLLGTLVFEEKLPAHDSTTNSTE